MPPLSLTYRIANRVKTFVQYDLLHSSALMDVYRSNVIDRSTTAVRFVIQIEPTDTVETVYEVRVKKLGTRKVQ